MRVPNKTESNEAVPPIAHAENIIAGLRYSLKYASGISFRRGEFAAILDAFEDAIAECKADSPVDHILVDEQGQEQ